jgi:uncharacterized protein YwbE
VLAAAQEYSDTGKVTRGVKERVLKSSSAQIKRAAQSAPVKFCKGVEVTLDYGSGFVNKRKHFA